eukprot:1920162-Lingulodinium_polyedra.AAC.1
MGAACSAACAASMPAQRRISRILLAGRPPQAQTLRSQKVPSLSDPASSLSETVRRIHSASPSAP